MRTLGAYMPMDRRIALAMTCLLKGSQGDATVLFGEYGGEPRDPVRV